MRSGVAIFLLAGCGTTYVPKASGDIRAVAPPGWTAKGSVSFVNAQPSTQEVTIGKESEVEPVTTNLHDWTEVVIHYARDVVRPAAGIAKSISMRVTGAKMFRGAYATLVVVKRPTCEVELEIATGNGYHAVYHAGGKTFYDWEGACEDATREVTMQVFQDMQVIKYLNE
jgi:hypothetical protein